VKLPETARGLHVAATSNKVVATKRSDKHV
jgi:hypothetical protein